MSLRDSLLFHLAPSVLPGIRFGAWLRLLRENRFDLQPRYAARGISITACSLLNSAAGWLEDLWFGARIRQTEVVPPLFILGHWRSGTTLLQNLIAVDRRFASPSLYEVLFPSTFLTTERWLSNALSFAVPDTRPTDKVKFGLNVPYEDEFALCASLCSPLLSMVFPERATVYDRFITLRELQADERAAWNATFLRFLQKLTFTHRRPLVLKSPLHTARVGHLLTMFPEARFVHIHRDPFAVYQSAVRITQDSSRRQRLQDPRRETIEDRVLRVYRLMHDALFEDIDLVPRNRYHEIAFEDLERSPKAVLKGMYESLDLPAFDEIEREVDRYVETLQGYRKNSNPPLPEEVRRRIVEEWKRCFEKWGYSTSPAGLTRG